MNSKIMMFDGLVDRPTVGRVCLANEGAFGASFLSRPLTDYAAGWKTEDKKLEDLLEFLAPGVPVAKRFEYRKANNGDEFALVEDVERALFGEFKMVKSIGEVVQGKTTSKGLTTVIEKDSELEGDRERKVQWLKKMLIRADIKLAYAALNTAATNTAKTWSSKSTPDSDVLTAIAAFGDAVGIDANRVVYGSTAWTKRLTGLGLQDGAEGRAQYAKTQEELANWFAADVLVSRERYTSGSGKSALATANQVMVFAGEAGGNIDDPSSVKRFYTPKDGGEWRVYVDEVTMPELVKITVCHDDCIATTISTGVQKLTIS